MDLFAHARAQQMSDEAPLAARMRPRTLDEFVGQDHVIGPGRLLRRAIQADQLTSVIFYGPPGTGKTTLAMVIANTTSSTFVVLNAVLAGVKNLREVTHEAQEERKLYGRRTILFVDEVHRWNKAQQDALLPWVENGTIIMIGATTENPWFSVNRPLLSRSRVFQLVPLTEPDLRAIVQSALKAEGRGYGDLEVAVNDDALEHLVHVANGDARSLLNALQLAVETTEPDEDGVIVVDLAVAEDSIQRRAVLYDREGDYHFDTISAFIKSVRGSDPDATLYWLAKMVYAGEDPRFLFRRMLILASEDVGLADPQALVVVQSAAAAFERVGLPEGQFHLAQAALYLATAAKSGSVMGYFEARAAVEAESRDEVPTHLKDASRDREGFGHGQGYLYPHAYRDHWVAQQYLPPTLQGRVFYDPSDQGKERDTRIQVLRRREEQLAATVGEGLASTEVLTFSPSVRSQERWLERAVSQAGQRLGEVRDRIFAHAGIQRHSCVLDLNAGTGLLTWEAVRRAPEGGVWALVQDGTTAAALREQAERLPEVDRPHILEGGLRDVQILLTRDGSGSVRFDAILGRNVLTRSADKAADVVSLAELVGSGGCVCLAEDVPRHTQRLYDLVDGEALPDGLADAWRDAEEAIYADPDDPMVNWDEHDLRAAFDKAGFGTVAIEMLYLESRPLLSAETVARWFGGEKLGRPSYAQLLGASLTEDEVLRVAQLLERQLEGQSVPWVSTTALAWAGHCHDA